MDASAPSRRPWLLVHFAHLLVTGGLLGDLLAGRVLFFRDLSVFYFPNYVFLAQSLRAGVWPLWNPTGDGGGPFLNAYPPDLLLAALGGARVTMSLGVFLHGWLAASGASALARRLGAEPLGAWAAGAAFGLSGVVLSLVNLLPLFQAAAWAPWVLVAVMRLAEAPTFARAVALSIPAALQVSTLGAEVILQTALLVPFIVPWGRCRTARHAKALAAALPLTAALCGPVLLGARSLVLGTSRTSGFGATEALAFSLHPAMLIEAWWPHFFGDVHSASDEGFWAQPFFPEGYPYLLSLYLGIPALMLAARAGRHRLLWPAALGVVLALGAYGPVGLLSSSLRIPLRTPVKFFFLPTLCVALLAGLGAARASARPRRFGALLLVPGLTLLALAAAAEARPAHLCELLSRVLPALASPRAEAVARLQWPGALLLAGALSAGAGLVLMRGGRLAALAAPLLALDLLATNGVLNTTTDAAFYQLRPEVRALLALPERDRNARWFSYGLANTPAPVLRPGLPSDAWLYYLDRQSLLPRANVLDGLDSALDVDRTGWAPTGATLSVSERRPELFRAHHDRLRESAVRYVLSFVPLPEDLLSPLGQTLLPGMAVPLRLYELRDPLPRAFLAGGSEPPDQAWRLDPSLPPVVYTRLDAHRVRVEADGPRGHIVVLDGYHPHWTAVGPEGPVPLRKVGARALAFATPGGPRQYLLEFRPPWRPWAWALAAAGALAALVLCLRPLRLDSPPAAR